MPRRCVLVLVTLLAVVTTSCAGLRGADDDVAFTSGDSTITQFDAGKGDAVDFPEAVPSIDGATLDLDALARNKVVVLNVWASWCGPCISEADALRQTAERFAEDDIEFVGINVRDSKADALAFVRHYRIDFPNVSDPSSEELGQLSPKLTFGIPMTAVVAPDGRMSAVVKGAVTTATLAALVEDALPAE